MAMMMRTIYFLVMALGLSGVGLGPDANAQARSGVKLVLQITIDGLRADLLNRYGDRFGQGGFRHLMENGTRYTNGRKAVDMTYPVGIVSTGTFPGAPVSARVKRNRRNENNLLDRNSVSGI